MDKKNSKKILGGIFVLFACVLFSPVVAKAANLYFSPTSGSYNVGGTFVLGVYVSSADKAMNAASGTISFPQDKFEITSISKTSSIISLWVQEPSFSNNAGTANFEGIVLNPGFTGNAGKLLSVTFRVKAQGAASVTFSSGSVLANDGYGTNILASLGNAAFSLLPTAKTPSPAPTPPSSQEPVRIGVPSAPTITSSTHPNSESWYQSNKAKFAWDVPSDIDAVRILVGDSSSSIPTIVYAPPIDSRDVSELNLPDGVWYFHAQMRNESGWGGIARYKFQIDATKPEYFNLRKEEREDATDPQTTLVLSSRDKTSGIDHYEFQIDDLEVVSWRDDGSHEYETSALKPGKRILIAKAVDKAGNYLADSQEITIEPLQTPTITDYPQTIGTGKQFSVKGVALSNETVAIWFQRGKDDPQSISTTSNGSGTFAATFEEGIKEAGSYKMWAVTIDRRGAQSLPSEKVSLQVERPALFKFGALATTTLAILIPIIALLALLAGLIWYIWYQYTRWRKRIRKEVGEAEQALHKAFALLKDDMQGQIKMLEKIKTKRQLTQEEEKIVKQLKKDLTSAEKFISKEIEDIKKQVKS